MKKKHSVPFALLGAAGMTLSLAACNGGSSAAPSQTVTSTASAPTTTVTSSSAPATSTATATATATQPASTQTVTNTAPNTPIDDGSGDAAECTAMTVKLKTAPDPDGTGAGHTGWAITATNSSDAACSVKGFPGVVLIWGQGNHAGPGAERTSDTPQAIVLQPGQAAVAKVSMAQAGNYPNCDKISSNGWEVIMPNDTSPIFSGLNQSVDACKNPDISLLTVKPFVPA